MHYTDYSPSYQFYFTQHPFCFLNIFHSWILSDNFFFQYLNSQLLFSFIIFYSPT